ncbi:MAG: LysM peptidoglycan-binding domain-containing protein [Verrucomicrobiota bacterium]
MIFFSRKLVALLAIPLLTQCGGIKSAPQTQTVTGPFDSRGNYVEDWVDQPDKWYRPPAPGTKTKPKTEIASNTQTRPEIQTLPEPHVPLIETTSPPEIVKTSPTTIEPKVKPKPKPTPKPPTVTRHTVKRGDTLSAIAKRYKTTISKIQTANGLKGSVIRLGQTLKIPR